MRTVFRVSKTAEIKKKGMVFSQGVLKFGLDMDMPL